MQWTGLNELREKFLSFFESKGCLRLPSFSLVPKDDNSLLLINSGMAPMKKYFTGEITPPRKRVTTCQKCIRTPDIERVGITARHGTFFEMLGNFSFGDYFKREATAWAWEFFTEVLEMPVDKLYVSIYQDDDEAYKIWTEEVGVDPSHMVRLGKEGVLQGVKDSSGDDVQFRWLCIENEEAGHPLQVFTGHEVVVDGAYMSGADGSVPGLGNIDPYSYVEQWKAYQAGDWERVREIQNHLAKLMGVTRNVHATVGFGAGVGAFKTALWQMGVFNTNQMREPVQPLVGEDVEAIVAVLKANGLMDADAPIRK